MSALQDHAQVEPKHVALRSEVVDRSPKTIWKRINESKVLSSTWDGDVNSARKYAAQIQHSIELKQVVLFVGIEFSLR